MSIKDKIKSIIGKHKTALTRRKNKVDSELGAEEVLREEVFPKKSKNSSAKKSPSKPAAKSAAKSANGKSCNCAAKTTAKSNAAKKPASKRTRPTNVGYEMIDPSGDTFDANKS